MILKKIGMVSLGCPKNLVDAEIMLGILKNNNYEITADKEMAEILVVNTCGFIESAKQESINTILEMSKAKEKNCEMLIVTGCLAERYKDEILNEIPLVDAVVGTGSYESIVDVVEKLYKGSRFSIYGELSTLDYLKNKREVSTNKGFAYLKIAEGCDNCCTYCIIPSLRGGFRSRNLEDIVIEAKEIAKNGAKEIILIAQDVTRYGTDIYKSRRLVELIRELTKIEDIEWIRLLYCYPEEIDDALINEIATNDKVCKYIDVPIQHISNTILKRMGRRGTKEQIVELMVKLRDKIPEIIIRTSLIVGFPAETEEEFSELVEFVGKSKFDRLGVFTYSREEDTAAAKFKKQISKKIKKVRYNQIMSLQNEISVENSKKRLNRVYSVIVEGVSEDGIFYFGRSYAEAPDIDGNIYFTSGEPLKIGDIYKVKILNIDEYDLIGEIIL